MFFAIANSILIPLLNDEGRFQTEFGNIFPNHQHYSPHVKNLLKQVNKEYAQNNRSEMAQRILEDDEIYEVLIQDFRERTVQTMYDHIIGNDARGIEANPDYYSGFNLDGIETIDEGYLEGMKDPKTWAGNHELCAISELLNKRIKLPTTTIQRDGQELVDTNPIVEIHYNGNTHYEAMLDQNVLDRIKQEILN